MPIIKVTKADILKTQNCTPGWYSCQVVKVNAPEKSSGGGSINYVIDCVILPGQEKEGKVIPARFNSQLIGKIAPLWFACTGTEISEDGLDLDELMGKKFDGKVVPNNYNGVMYDNFDSFVPYGRGKDAGDVPF